MPRRSHRIAHDRAARHDRSRRGIPLSAAIEEEER
jgi:hypothetical protein